MEMKRMIAEAMERKRLNQGLKKNTEERILEPAEYLLKTTKYHDCYLTVGDPVTKEVERFGVVTSQLIAHSTVFREMLVDSKLADPTGANTHISDVSPEVFKLMLIHVYGGQLPAMTRETAAELALCADKYNIEPLVNRVTAVLTPTSVNVVFPALRCVVYINLPDLEQHVTKIIQEQTAEVVRSKEFLGLDDNCVEFIVKQEKLAITELELWKSLVKWVKHQTKERLKMRKTLSKPLQHLRLLSLSKTEIIEEVMPAKIISAEEVIDLLSAVSGKGTLQSPGLCSALQKRALFTKVDPVETSANSQILAVTRETTLSLLDSSKMFTSYSTQPGGLQTASNFKIKTLSHAIDLVSFTFQSLSLAKNVSSELTYVFTCIITVRKVEEGYSKVIKRFEIRQTVMCDEDVAMSVMLPNGNLLRLYANSYYNISLRFTPAHGTFRTFSLWGDTTYCERNWRDYLTFQSNTPFHIQKIKCKLIQQ